MSPIEIIVIVLCVLFVAAVVIGSAVKKARNKKNGVPACCCDCSSCRGCNKRLSAEEIKELVNKHKSPHSNEPN